MRLFAYILALILMPMVAIASMARAAINVAFAFIEVAMRPSLRAHLHLMPGTPRSILETRRMGLA